MSYLQRTHIAVVSLPVSARTSRNAGSAVPTLCLYFSPDFRRRAPELGRACIIGDMVRPAFMGDAADGVSCSDALVSSAALAVFSKRLEKKELIGVEALSADVYCHAHATSNARRLGTKVSE